RATRSNVGVFTPWSPYAPAWGYDQSSAITNRMFGAFCASVFFWEQPVAKAEAAATPVPRKSRLDRTIFMFGNAITMQRPNLSVLVRQIGRQTALSLTLCGIGRRPLPIAGRPSGLGALLERIGHAD